MSKDDQADKDNRMRRRASGLANMMLALLVGQPSGDAALAAVYLLTTVAKTIGQDADFVSRLIAEEWGHVGVHRGIKVLSDDPAEA